jgi:hypothetical protein
LVTGVPIGVQVCPPSALMSTAYDDPVLVTRTCHQPLWVDSAMSIDRLPPDPNPPLTSLTSSARRLTAEPGALFATMSALT